MIKGATRNRLLPPLAHFVKRPSIVGSNRLLIFQPDHLGDILLSEPAVRLLRQSLPNTELIAAVGPWAVEITTLAWPVDRVVTVEFPGFARSETKNNPTQPYLQLHNAARNLRHLNVDDALVLRDDAWWAAWLARSCVGRHVVGSSNPQTQPFATKIANVRNNKHRTEIAMNIVTIYLAQLGITVDTSSWDMSPSLLASQLDNPELRPQNVGSIDKPYVVIHPGSGAEVKSWTIARWRAVIKSIQPVNVILSGNESEQELCFQIARGLGNARSVAGITSLPDLIRILRQAEVAVGIDNGPMHLAGAVGTATVRLFGPSNPAIYGPWPDSSQHTVVSANWCCPKCDDLSPARTTGCGCMLAIEPAQVINAIGTALNRVA